LKRQKGKKNTTLMYQTLAKITPEDIFLWIREGFKQVQKNQELIIKTFQKCGYIDEINKNIEVMDEVSNHFSNMIIESENELAESIPLEDTDGDEDEEENGEDNMDNFENFQNDKNRMEIE